MNKKGFTLVELIAVIVLIAIIAVAAITGVNAILNRQRVRTATMSEENINQAAVALQSEKHNIYLPACVNSSGKYINIPESTLKTINNDLRTQMKNAGKTTEEQQKQYVKDYVKTLNDNSDPVNSAKKVFSDKYIGAKDLNCFRVTSVADLMDGGYLKDLANGCDRASLVIIYNKADSANTAGNIKSVQETGICKGSESEEKGPLITVDPEKDLRSTASKTIKITATANESNLQDNLTLTYGWSKSVRTQPSTWKTKSLSGNESEVSTTVTISGMDEEFYLWIRAGSFKDDKGFTNSTFATGPYAFLPTPNVTYKSLYEDDTFPLRGGKRCGGEVTCNNKKKQVVYTKPYGQNVTGGDAPLCTPVCTGYNFTGWIVGEERAINDNSRVEKREDHDIKATYEPKQPLVTFDANGGTPSSPRNKTVTYDSQYGELATTSRTGYLPVGDWWTEKTSGTEVHTTTYVSKYEDHSLYKHWEPIRFNIAYNGNGNTGGSTAAHQCIYDRDCLLANNGFTRTSYTFNGWKKANAGNALKAGTNVKNVTSTNNDTVTYYAQWCRNCIVPAHGSCTLTATTPGTCSYVTSCSAGYHNTSGNNTYNATCGPNTFTVAYNGNGATSGSTSSHTCTYDSACSLKANGFAKKGHVFAGWKKANAGSTLAAGASIKNAVTSGTVTYYAQWTACGKGTYESGGTCKSCPAGQYQDSTGQTSCKNAPVGHYQDSPGQPTYKKCAAGTYQNATGKTSCPSCAACYTSAAGASSCYDNTKPKANEWTLTSIDKASLTADRAHMVIKNVGSDCGSGLASIKYWTSCNGTVKTGPISGSDATIDVPPCANVNVVLYYKLVDKAGNESGTISVPKIGLYALYGQVYNYMLFDGPVPNNSTNLKGHVDATSGTVVWPKVKNELIATAINAHPEWSDAEFVRRTYLSVLGREQEIFPPQSGACTWRIVLSRGGGIYTDANGCYGLSWGYSRLAMLGVFYNNPEPQIIYNAWGFTYSCC